MTQFERTLEHRLNGDMLSFQASVSGDREWTSRPCQRVYGTHPVSTHPLGATECLMSVDAGAQN